MIAFVADPLRLLFRRSLRTALLASLILLLCGCELECPKQTQGNVQRYVTTTDSNGVVSHLPEDESYGQEPVEDVFPPDYDSDGIDPDNPEDLARSSVSVSGTFFGLAANGSILQYDVPSTSVVRRLTTQFDWTTGVGSLVNDRIYAVASGTQGGTGFSPSLSIVNMTTFVIEQTIPLPATLLPRSVAMSADGKYLYIGAPANGASSTTALLIFDTAAKTIAKTVTIDGSTSRPQLWATRDGGLIFLTTNRGVAVFDALTQTLSHTISLSIFGTLHIALDPVGNALYIAPLRSQGSFGVGVYDIATSTQTRFIPVADLQTMAMAVSPDGTYLAIDQTVSDAQGRNDFPVIQFIDVATGRLLRTHPWKGSRNTPYAPRELLILPDR